MVIHKELQKKAFVNRWPLYGASETTYPIFTGQIKTGLSGQETANCRWPLAQVWLNYVVYTPQLISFQLLT